MSRPSINDYMDYEEPDPVWFPGVGEKARIVGDWSMGFGQVGEVVRIEPYRDSDGAIDGASIIVRLDNGSEDSYDFEDLLHPDEAWQPEDDFDDDDEPAFDGEPCPSCGSQNTELIDTVSDDPIIWHCECGSCGAGFEIVDGEGDK